MPKIVVKGFPHTILVKGTKKTCQGPSVNCTYRCSSCNVLFTSQSALFRHERQTGHNDPSTFGCNSEDTGNNTSNFDTEVPHNETTSQFTSVSTNDRLAKKFKCRSCTESFHNHALLYKHRMVVHKQTGAGPLQADPWESANIDYPWVNEDGSENEHMRSAYDIHRHIILRERVNEGRARDTYNFPLSNTLNADVLMEQIEAIYENSQTAFKINISLGLILQNIETGAYRFFRSVL